MNFDAFPGVYWRWCNKGWEFVCFDHFLTGSAVCPMSSRTSALGLYSARPEVADAISRIRQRHASPAPPIQEYPIQDGLSVSAPCGQKIAVDSTRMELLCWLLHHHHNFRLPELESVAAVVGVPSPLYSPETAEAFVANRGTFLKACPSAEARRGVC